jgi:hypothetical protein
LKRIFGLQEEHVLKLLKLIIFLQELLKMPILHDTTREILRLKLEDSMVLGVGLLKGNLGTTGFLALYH